MLFRNVHEPQVLSNHRSILPLDERVVVRLSGTALRLVDQELLQKPRDDFVDVLAPIVGVKDENHKGELRERIFERGLEERFRDTLDACHNLILGHLIHQINVVHPLLFVPISLVHRIHSQESRAPFRVRLLPFSDWHRYRAGLRIVQCLRFEPLSLLEVIESRDGNACETDESLVAIHLQHFTAYLLERFAVLVLIPLGHIREKRNVLAGVSSLESRLRPLFPRDLSDLLVFGNQVIHIAPGVSSIQSEVSADDAFFFLLQETVPETNQEIIHPLVYFINAIRALYLADSTGFSRFDEFCYLCDAFYAIVVHSYSHIQPCYDLPV